MKAQPRFPLSVLVFCFLFLILPGLTGCTVPFQQSPIFNDIDLKTFPVSRTELLALSHRNYRIEGPSKFVAQSLVAAQNLHQREPNHELANYYTARAAFWLIEYGGKNIDEEEMARHGYESAEKLIASDPSRAEYSFLAGAHMGIMIKHSLRPSVIRLRKVRDFFENAAKLNPRLNEGGPLRALGMIYVLSPPWPAGVGDIDEGIDTLKQAVQMFPTCPENHIYLAKGYIEDKRWEDAKKSLIRAKNLSKAKFFGMRGEYWGSECKNLIKQVDEKLEKKNKKKSK